MIEKELSEVMHSPTPNREDEELMDPILEVSPTIESPSPDTPKHKIIQQEEEIEPQSPLEKTKMIITGDDILIEYVNRLIQLIENIKQAYTLKWS